MWKIPSTDILFMVFSILKSSCLSKHHECQLTLEWGVLKKNTFYFYYPIASGRN